MIHLIIFGLNPVNGISSDSQSIPTSLNLQYFMFSRSKNFKRPTPVFNLARGNLCKARQKATCFQCSVNNSACVWVMFGGGTITETSEEINNLFQAKLLTRKQPLNQRWSGIRSFHGAVCGARRVGMRCWNQQKMPVDLKIIVLQAFINACNCNYLRGRSIHVGYGVAGVSQSCTSGMCRTHRSFISCLFPLSTLTRKREEV